MIELAQSDDGRLVLGTDEPFPFDIKYIEYYREQRLFSLVFENDDSSLIPVEISAFIGETVERAPSMIVLEVTKGHAEPYRYIVPLVQVGL